MCGKREMTKRDQQKQVNLGNIFGRHVKHEFVDHDVDSTNEDYGKGTYCTSCAHNDRRHWF
jgi:hypothetical protein